MSSDSDIECDTENEEQEDATSTSEGFNHAFSVQSSSEGKWVVWETFPGAPAGASVCLLMQAAPAAEITGDALEVLSTSKSQ